MTTLLAYPHPGQVAGIFASSLTSLVQFEDEGEVEVLPVYSGPDLFSTRNKIAAHFLSTTHDYLFFVDSDMGFGPDALFYLRDLAERAGGPVVMSALYFGHRESPTPSGPFPEFVPYPHMYRREGSMYRPASDFDTNSLIKVDAVGAGCLLIPRAVLEAIEDEPGLGPAPFSQVASLGEDFSFCERLASLRIPLFVHTGIKTAHLKPTYLTERTYMDYWTTK